MASSSRRLCYVRCAVQWCAVLWIGAPTGTCMAQESAPTTSLSGSLELARLVDLTAQRLSLRIEYVPAQLTGSTTLRGDIADSELWSMTNSRLAEAGWTTIAAGAPKQFKIAKLDANLSSSTSLLDAVWSLVEVQPGNRHLQVAWDDPALRPGFVSVVVPLRFRSGKEVAEIIKPLLSKPAGSVQTLGEGSDRIVIADLTSRLDDILRLLPQIDVPAESGSVESVPVRNISAAQAVASAKEIAAKRDLVGSGAATGKSAGELIAAADGQSVLVIAPKANLQFFRDLITSLDAQPPVTTKEYVPQVFAIKDVASLISQVVGVTQDSRFKVVTDELTGTLIVTATTEQQGRIADLIARLDSTPSDASSRLRSFPIRHRPVKEVADSLNQLLGAGAIEVGPDSSPSRAALVPPEIPNVANPSPAAGTRTALREDATRGEGRRPASGAGITGSPRVTITIDEGMNTLIAVGEPRVLSQIEALLKTLDVRQPQVMIEVTLVSLTDGQSLALGVELQKFTTLGGNVIQLSSLFGSRPTGNPPNISGAPGAGFTGAVLNPGDFNAVIQALERVNAGRSSSTPRVLVSNNQEASFKSVAQQPTSNTSTNTTSTTITSFGGFQDAGTTIRVKPQIAEGDQLVLDYDVQLSSFTGIPQNGLPSARQENSVASVSLIPDGYTVVVGGFELKTDSEDESRVPLIGQIPIVGELFKTRNTAHDRTRFYVFIHASVMRSGGFEDLKYLSDRDTVAAGVPDGWPEVEPLLIR